MNMMMIFAWTDLIDCELGRIGVLKTLGCMLYGTIPSAEFKGHFNYIACLPFLVYLQLIQKLMVRHTVDNGRFHIHSPSDKFSC